MHKSKRVAFVIPLDTTRHLRYVKNLAYLASDFSDVFVVLSRSSDLILVEPHLTPEIRTLVLTDWITEDSLLIAERRRSVPTFKKWIALQRLIESFDAKNRYEYCVCCDSEIRVLRPIDAEFVAALPSQFVFVGDHLSSHASYDNYRKILLDASTRSQSAIESSSCVGRLMTWWSGLPIYSTETLPDFLGLVGAQDAMSLAKSLKWEAFDHMTYQRYAVSRHINGAVFVCLSHDTRTPTGWSLEDVATDIVYAASRKAGLATLWATRKTMERIPELSNYAYIEYHMDH